VTTGQSTGVFLTRLCDKETCKDTRLRRRMYPLEGYILLNAYSYQQIRFYYFADKLKARKHGHFAISAKAKANQRLTWVSITCSRGIFTIPPTSNINRILTCVREMLLELPSERKLFYLVKPLVEHLPLYESYLARDDHTSKHLIRFSSSCSIGLLR
jgi:hypothetical protein